MRTTMTINYIDPRDVSIPRHHRAIKPWVLEQLKRSMQDHGYNAAYPITLDGQNTLVDGRHRVEAAKELGIRNIPWVPKPDGASPIKFALQCNADGQLAAPNDVFDLAELCHGLSEEGWTGQKIAEELGWSDSTVGYYKQIRERLHPRVWHLARNNSTKISELWGEDEKSFVEHTSTIVEVWRESRSPPVSTPEFCYAECFERLR